MNFKKIVILYGFILFTVITSTVLAEEVAVAPSDPVVSASDQQAAPKNESVTQWVWGEVVNLDSAAKTVTLKYLDYETDQEKELVLVADDKTVLENIKSLDEIKLKDTLSVDYITGLDGKNIAKNINLEKPDSAPVVPVEAAVPAVMEQPAAVVEAPVPVAAAPVVSTEVVQPSTPSAAAPAEVVQPAAPAEAAQSETPAVDEVAIPVKQNQSSSY